MDVAFPYSAVSPSLDGEVLVTLARTTRPLTGRNIARLCRRGSQSSINEALRRLQKHGIVTVLEAGHSCLYTLNRDHIAVPAVETLAQLKNTMIQRITSSIENWDSQPVSVVLFGSAARSDGDTNSDIDILIVRPELVSSEDAQWRSAIDELAEKIKKWTGNHAGIADISENEILTLRKTNPPILKDLSEHGITILGKKPKELFAL